MQGKVKRMEVVEDFDSRPIKVVTFLVERDTEIQKMPNALPRHSGGKLPRRSNTEEGKEIKEEEKEVRRVENEVMNAILTAEPIESGFNLIEFFTVVPVLHQTLKTGRTSSLLLLNRAGTHLCHYFTIQHRSMFLPTRPPLYFSP